MLGMFKSKMWIPAKLAFYALVGALVLQASPEAVPARDSAPRVTPSAAPAPAPPPASLPALAPARARTSLPDIPIHSELDIGHWLSPGEFAWNDEGAPPGRTTIVINIRARVMSVYREGVEIGRSSITYGADNKPTPTGTFTILQKDADHVSNLYDAPMPHMLRLTWDGIAIHGAEIGDDLATRGCVGLPTEFAELLFGAAQIGDQVVIWSGTAPA